MSRTGVSCRGQLSVRRVASQVRRLAQWMKDTREENRQTPLYVPASGAGVSAAAPRPHRRCVTSQRGDTAERTRVGGS